MVNRSNFVSEVFSLSESVTTESLVGIVLQFADGTIAACNTIAEEILGYSSDRPIGKKSFDSLGQTIHTDGSAFLPENRETYRRYLLADRECNYTIVEASLGKVGLDKCKQSHFDLIFLDYRLPDLDGLEFVTRLQQEIGRSTPPIIMLTGQGNEAIASQAIKAGVFDYLVKGKLTSEELCLAVRRAIENAQICAKLQQVEAEASLRESEEFSIALELPKH
jgi:CheY-like chemotaxis protein